VKTVVTGWLLTEDTDCCQEGIEEILPRRQKLVRCDGEYVGKSRTVKVKVKQSYYRPVVAQRVPEIKNPKLHDNGTG
jgi:hypothetical protein